MNKQASLTKTSEKNGRDSHPEKPKENFSPSISPTGQILQMQQTIGNQAVKRLFKSGAIQAKLKTGKPGNQYEQEADRAADCIAQNRDCREKQLSPVEPQIQHAPANENQTPPPSPPPETQTETTTRATVPLPGQIVEDTATVLANGQMKKTQFLDQLQVAVCSTVNRILKGTEYSTDSCPYIQFYLLYYRMKSSNHIERALLRYAPEAAGAKTARDYINFIIARVAMATVIWLNTGEVTGVPKGFSAAGPGEGSEGEGTTAGVSAKARAGGLKNADNLQAIQSRLGPGQPLDGGVRSRIGSAFSQDFSHVRIHTDANAAQLSDSLNARAFTIGKDIAFAPGEYRPGTMIGDALIAHELAHTIQQDGGSVLDTPMQKGAAQNSAFEEDADMSAVGAVASIWSRFRSGFANIAENAIPRLRSGLRLQRCEDKGKSGEVKKKAGYWSILSRGGANPFIPGGKTDEEHVEGAFRTICPLATRSGRLIKIPLDVAPGSNPHGCACLQDIGRKLVPPLKSSNPPAVIKVVPFGWSSAQLSYDPVVVSARHPDDPFEWGYWTTTTKKHKKERRHIKPFWQTVAHEICGHVAIYARSDGKRTGGRGELPREHDVAIEGENIIAGEQKVPEHEQRGYQYDYGPRRGTRHAGESFLAATLPDFAHISDTFPTSPAAKNVIDSLVNSLNRFPLFVELEGSAYADEGGNIMAQKRAETVKNKITSRGISDRFIPFYELKKGGTTQVNRFKFLPPKIEPGTSIPAKSQPGRKVRIYLYHDPRSAGP